MKRFLYRSKIKTYELSYLYDLCLSDFWMFLLKLSLVLYSFQGMDFFYCWFLLLILVFFCNNIKVAAKFDRSVFFANDNFQTIIQIKSNQIEKRGLAVCQKFLFLDAALTFKLGTYWYKLGTFSFYGWSFKAFIVCTQKVYFQTHEYFEVNSKN